jgi:molybdopterin converting factor small subunit
MIEVHLPGDLARALGAPPTVIVPPLPDLARVVAYLEARYPGLARSLTEADGSFRPHLAVFVGDRAARGRDAGALLVQDGETVWVLRAVSGG